MSQENKSHFIKKDAPADISIPLEYFFTFEADCHQLQKKFEKKHFLPHFSKLLDEEQFAEVGAGWNQSGLYFFIEVSTPEIAVSFPDIQKGDSIELFIDTKNLKSTKSTHRFCHHFYFLPERVEGVLCKEITHFRTEDSHPLCNPDDIQLKITKRKSSYEADICIPTECLTGFQPEVGQSIGFTYRINRSKGPAQHFAVSSQHCQIEYYPHLWGTLKLV